MPPQIQHKRGTSSDIASVNPILLDGEIVFETDTKKFKFGDGSTSWNNLPYAVLPNSGVSISGINIISGSGNFNTLTVSSVPVSVSGHSHTSSNITNFNTAVSGLLPVTNITAGTNISISSDSGNFTINSTAAGGGASISNSGLNRLLTSDGSTSGIIGQSNLTFDGSLLNITGSGNFANGIFVSGVPIGEVIDDEVAGLLVAGSGITLNYNDNANTLTVRVNNNVINSSNLYLWANFR